MLTRLTLMRAAAPPLPMKRPLTICRGYPSELTSFMLLHWYSLNYCLSSCSPVVVWLCLATGCPPIRECTLTRIRGASTVAAICAVIDRSVTNDDRRSQHT